MESFFEANSANWDERAGIHAEDVTGAYAIARFLAGDDVLYPIEAAALDDIAGRDVLHLQCHIGIDTLCLARGAGDRARFLFRRADPCRGLRPPHRAFGTLRPRHGP